MKKVYSYTYNVLERGNVILSCHGAVELDDFIQSKEEYSQIMRGETLKIKNEYPDYQIVFTSSLSLLNPEKTDHHQNDDWRSKIPPPKEVGGVESKERSFLCRFFWRCD